ncbi:MAG: hypothetical protein MI741_03925, partial [Rhodospirillales bacterium]|nr:hypothetical protein [Rhodospirillales bacterium]
MSLAIFAVASSTPLLALPRSAPEHPRLYFTSDTLSDIHEKIESDEQTGRWYAQIKKHAERILNQPPSKYEIPDGKRLLSTSRRVLD